MFTAFTKSRKFIKTLSAFLVNNQILQKNTLKQKVIPIQRSSTTKYIYIYLRKIRAIRICKNIATFI